MHTEALYEFLLLLEIELDELLQGVENTSERIERNGGFEF